MSFDLPKYFYDEADPPDLVNTNGPIYSRTPVNLGNIVPQPTHTMNAIQYRFSSSGIPAPSIDFVFSVVAHDLHVVRMCAAPMSDDTGDPILSVSLSGYLQLSTTYDNPIEKFCLEIVTESFTTGGNAQGSFNVFSDDTTTTEGANHPFYAGTGCFVGQGYNITSIFCVLESTGYTPMPKPSDVQTLRFYC